MDWTWNWDRVLDLVKTDGEISYWKVLGHSVALVGVAVSLPVSGPVALGALATSDMAAIVTASLGAGAVAAVTNNYLDDRKRKRAEALDKRHASERERAEDALKFKKYEEAFAAELSKGLEAQYYFDLIVALAAVGMACAACDGAVSADERADIEAFIATPGVKQLPQAVRAKLDFLTANPPSIATAFELAKQYGGNSLDLFDDIIDLVIYSDGIVHSTESVFLLQWAELKSTVTRNPTRV